MDRAVAALLEDTESTIPSTIESQIELQALCHKKQAAMRLSITAYDYLLMAERVGFEPTCPG